MRLPVAPVALAGFCLLLAASADSLYAAELRSLEMGEDGARHWLRMEVVLAAPPAAVYSVITDYDKLTRLHRNIVGSEVVGRIDARTVEVYTLIRACIVGVFCRRVKRVERITENPPDSLEAEALPERSDLAYGRVHWRLEPEARGSVLYYESEIEPDFWVPRLFGKALLAKMIERTTVEMIEQVEALALAETTGSGAAAGKATRPVSP